jgi:hypothetical protein
MFVDPLLASGHPGEFDHIAGDGLPKFIPFQLRVACVLANHARSMGTEFEDFLANMIPVDVLRPRRPAHLDPIAFHDIEWAFHVCLFGGRAMLQAAPAEDRRGCMPAEFEEQASKIAESEEVPLADLPAEAVAYLRLDYLLPVGLELLEAERPAINNAVAEHLCRCLFESAAAVDDFLGAAGIDWRSLRDKALGGRAVLVKDYADSVLWGLNEEQRKMVLESRIDSSMFFHGTGAEE